MKPKPRLIDYHGQEPWVLEDWKRDTLIWCAETMAEAADTMERCTANQPTPTPPTLTLAQRETQIFKRWYAKASIANRLRYWTERSNP